MSRALFLVMTLSLLAPVLCAPRVARADEPAAGKGEISMSFEAETQIESVLKAAVAAGLPLQWNSADKQIRGRAFSAPVNLRCKSRELLDRLRAMLSFYELVIIPTGPADDLLYFVMDARQTSVLLRMKPETVEVTAENLALLKSQDGRYVSTTIRTRNITDVRALRNMLSRLITGQNIGNVVEVPETNALLVTDFAPVVAVVWEAVREMDVLPGTGARDAHTEAIQLRFARAEDVAEVLRRHFQPAQPTGNVARQPAPSVEQAPGARVTADARTNQILATGTTQDLEQIRAAVSLLDTPIKIEALQVHVVALSHAEADYTASILSSMLARAGGLWQAQAGFGPSFVADSRTNSLLISCTASSWEAIQKAVAEIDIPVVTSPKMAPK